MLIYDRFLARVMKISPIQRQSLISLAVLLGTTAIGYIATMYFAHVLGPAILGSFFVFLAYYGIFDLVGDGGFGKRQRNGSARGRTGCLLCRVHPAPDCLLFYDDWRAPHHRSLPRRPRQYRPLSLVVDRACSRNRGKHPQYRDIRDRKGRGITGEHLPEYDNQDRRAGRRRYFSALRLSDSQGES